MLFDIMLCIQVLKKKTVRSDTNNKKNVRKVYSQYNKNINDNNNEIAECTFEPFQDSEESGSKLSDCSDDSYVPPYKLRRKKKN